MSLEEAIKKSEYHLGKTSRSFVLPILGSPDYSNIGLPDYYKIRVMTHYLSARIQDTFEDSKLTFIEKEVLMNLFTDSLKTGNTKELDGEVELFEHKIIDKDDLNLVKDTKTVVKVFKSLDTESQECSYKWLEEMKNGMLEFHDKEIKDINDLNLYCYYVAGTVGNYLTESFCRKIDLDEATLNRTNSGCAKKLQLTNIIKNGCKDHLVLGRTYIPTKLLKEEEVSAEKLFNPQYEGEYIQEKMNILSQMVNYAEQHDKHSLEYINAFPKEQIRVINCITIPFLMSVATINLCKNNEAVFDSKKDIRISHEERDYILDKLNIGENPEKLYKEIKEQDNCVFAK